MMHELQPGDPQLIGPYRLRGRLGAGGMGQVFLGRSAGGRPVAVKVVRAHLAQDPEFRERFRREINVARKVSGLFTAPVIDADVDGPMPWLATAYVEGPSLAEAVSQHGPLPPRSVLALAKDPAQRPTAAQLLAGAAYPATGWLPEPVTRTFSLDMAQVGAPLTTTAAQLAPPSARPLTPLASPPGPGQAQPPGPGRAHRRAGRNPWRSRWRSLAAAAILAGLAGAGVTAGVMMTAGSPPAPVTPAPTSPVGY